MGARVTQLTGACLVIGFDSIRSWVVVCGWSVWGYKAVDALFGGDRSTDWRYEVLCLPKRCKKWTVT